MITTESKSILAKLMATEDITVEHRKVQTASFHPKTRVLTCPIWKDMDGDLYDLLMGHEVGHALYTPPDGWHDAVSKKGKSYKHFLNVIEDARIEKKIKRKYPGLLGPFHRAYNQLNRKDFFGLNERTRPLAFIDRINIHFKVGPFYKVEFHNDIELELLNEIHGVETWEDVLRVTDKIWEYSKEEQQQLMTDFFKQNPEMREELDEFEDMMEELDSEDFEMEESDDDGESHFGSDDFESEEGGKEEKSNSPKTNREKDSAISEKDQFTPRAETDENFRYNEKKLLDEKSREYRYVHVPTEINLNEIITPAKRVIGLIEEHYKEQNSLYDTTADYEYKSFKQKNDRYITMLAKEFEMRKAASKFSKAKVSTIGDIDINKIYKYKLDDAIFKKVMRVPKGKSHGLVLLLDKSGSMSDNMAASIEQILVLSYFCRKVNIPFVVYGFGNAYDAYLIDKTGSEYDPTFSAMQIQEKQFTSKSGEIVVRPVFLREYLNSSMTASEFQKSVKMLLLLRKTYEMRSGYRGYASLPVSESLSNTPLVESLFASRKVIDIFRSKHNLDIVNLVVVHDGDADALRHMYKAQFNEITTEMVSPEVYNTYLVDRKNKFSMQYTNSYNELRAATMCWLTKVTGAKVYGFFITGDHGRDIKNAIKGRFEDENLKRIHSIQDNWERGRQFDTWTDEHYKTIRKQKFLECKTEGYDNFFLIPGGSALKIDDDVLEVNGKVTSGKLTNAFMKMNKSRQINRVLVSKFIGGIAV
jgi:hypothetical protein